MRDNRFKLSFSEPRLERLLLRYSSREHSNQEIFVGALGRIAGSRGEEDPAKGVIVYTIVDLVPFPNLDERNRRLYATPPSSWFQTVREYAKLWYPEGDKRPRLIGFIHSHPGEDPQISKADRNFALGIWNVIGNFVMPVIGRGKRVRAYHVEKNDIIQIPVQSTEFKTPRDG